MQEPQKKQDATPENAPGPAADSDTSAKPADEENAAPPKKGRKETLYDKIPVTYKQVDIFVKVLVVLMVGFIIAGMIMGRR